MKKIVVGYDGHQPARRAVEEAAVFAGGTAAELHLVRVLEDSASDEDVKEALTGNDDLLSMESLVGVAIQSQVFVGSAADSLIDYAHSIDADLIVVGNRRVQGLERVLGSVAIDVRRHADCSVYVAHTALGA